MYFPLQSSFLQLLPHLLVVYSAVVFLFISASNATLQKPLAPTAETTAKRVAIIGAGAGGASTAYNLRKYADSLQIPVNITAYERASYVGGRSTTVNVFDNPAHPVELGASIFVSVNYNLVNASKELGLTVSSASKARPNEADETIAIWDGEKFVYAIKNSSGWWNTVRMLWRYGLAPIRAQSLMKSTVGKFLKLYAAPMFPFKSLSDAAADVGLLDTTSSHGKTFLDKNNISPDFAREIIQASTRVNYGQNLALIHGLESMVCLAAEGAMSIDGGNWRIFDGMVKSSGAQLLLNTSVTSIERNPNGTVTVTSVSNTSSSSTATSESRLFDEVVIAGPFQSSGISVSPPLDYTPDEIPYVKLHVTLFSSPHKISPKYFGSNSPVAETILTTLPKDLEPAPKEKGVGPAGFWSLSTLQTVPAPPNPSEDNNTQPQQPHYVYKIFSPSQLTASFLSQLLDLPNPTNTTYPPNSTIKDLPDQHISWSHEKIWDPYPLLYPRVTFEEIRLAPHVWYTGGIESFISTMETSALMGRNVAALVARSWEEDKRERDELVDGRLGADERRGEL